MTPPSPFVPFIDPPDLIIPDELLREMTLKETLEYEDMITRARSRRSPYIPQEPTPKQLEFLRAPQLELLYGGSAGGGKEVIIDTPVPTPQGWTLIGNLRPGDFVFAEDGTPMRVLAVSDPHIPSHAYRLTFSDGSTIDAADTHLWNTITSRDRMRFLRKFPDWKAQRRARRPSRAFEGGHWRRTDLGKRNARWAAQARKGEQNPNPWDFTEPRTTQEICNTLIERPETSNARWNHAIPNPSPIQLPEATLPVDPYCFGAWLGDGSKTTSTMSGIDTEIADEFRISGYEIRYRKDPKIGTVLGLITDIKKTGAFDNKHIPLSYLRSSFHQRLALLQGLIDTDGYVSTRGQVEIGLCRKELVDGVLELIRSLGITVTCRESDAKLNGRVVNRRWRMKFTTTLPVARLERKKIRLKAVHPTLRSQVRYITRIDPIPPAPMVCIQVANPRGIFLVGDGFIPTHNSSALLMAALQHVGYSDYRALLLRRTYKDLALPGALMDRAREWLSKTDARWNAKEVRWEFPSGSMLTFGYLETENDRYRYQGAEFAFIGFDEASQFSPGQYTYLFSRLRRLEGSTVPLRFRAASNPGGVGHVFLKNRFMKSPAPDRAFIPAGLDDNPHINTEEYEKALSNLTAVEYAQLRHGDWSAAQAGSVFKREWFVPALPVRELPPRSELRSVRYWDLAASDEKRSKDPDYTVGLLLSSHSSGKFFIQDIQRVRSNPGDVEALILATATHDGKEVAIRMEQEPGAAGLHVADYYLKVLAGYDFRAERLSGTKEVRAQPVAAQASRGKVHILDGAWNEDFLDEVEAFPVTAHDDQVDALSGAFANITMQRQAPIVAPVSIGVGASYWKEDSDSDSDSDAYSDSNAGYYSEY